METTTASGARELEVFIAASAGRAAAFGLTLTFSGVDVHAPIPRRVLDTLSQLLATAFYRAKVGGEVVLSLRSSREAVQVELSYPFSAWGAEKSQAADPRQLGEALAVLGDARFEHGQEGGSERLAIAIPLDLPRQDLGREITWEEAMVWFDQVRLRWVPRRLVQTAAR